MDNTCVMLYLFLLIILNYTESVNSVRHKIFKCCPENEYIKLFTIRNFKCATGKHLGNTTEIVIEDDNFVKTVKRFDDVFEMELPKNSTDKVKGSLPIVKLNLTPHLRDNGKLYAEEPNVYNRFKEVEDFCIDYMWDSKTNTSYYTFVKTKNIPFRRPMSTELLYITAMLASSFFLVLVIAVYMALPSLRNLAGMILMAYSASLLLGYLSLSTTKIIGRLGFNSVLICKIALFLIYFSFMSTFFWMNIMSFDIFWTFRGLVLRRTVNNRGERHKFAMYCLHAWGVPLLMAIALIVLNETDLSYMPWFIKPKVPQKGCLMEGAPRFFYLYIPMLILVSCNFILFAMTAYNISTFSQNLERIKEKEARSFRKNNAESKKNSTIHKTQKFRLMVCLKLSLVMGVSWLLEAAASFEPTPHMWYQYLTDAYNMLLGPAIFYIFVWKKRVLRLLRKRISSALPMDRNKWNNTSSEPSTNTATDSGDETHCLRHKIRPNPAGEHNFM